MADEATPDDDDDISENEDARALSPEDSERRASLAKLFSIRRKFTDDERRQLRAVYPLVFRAHVKRLWGRLRRRGLTPEEAKDLVQETFARAFEKICAVGIKKTLKALLNSVLKGKLKNFLRSQQRCPLSVGLPSSGALAPPTTAPESELVRALDRARDRADLHARLRTVLSDKLFAVVYLVLLNNLAPAEAATILKVPEPTVHSRLNRAKTRLYELSHRWVPPSKRDRVKVGPAQQEGQGEVT